MANLLELVTSLRIVGVLVWVVFLDNFVSVDHRPQKSGQGGTARRRGHVTHMARQRIQSASRKQY